MDWIPSPKSLVKFALSMMAVFAISELLGLWPYLTNPVSTIKNKLSGASNG